MSEVRLYCGDCLQVMPTLEAQSVDAILTDLPYGTTACSWDEVIPFAPMWEAVKHVLKPRGVFVTTASQPFTSKLIMSNPKWFKYEIIWNKEKPSSGLHAHQQPLRQHENILVFGNGAITYNPVMQKTTQRIDKPRKANNGEAFGGRAVLRQHNNNGQKFPRSILSLSNANQNDRDHPTQKPVALYEYLILTYTNAGETVLDMCAGSGTTGVAAVKTGRNFIGIEQRADYFAVMEKRIRDAQQQPTLWEGGVRCH
jgi:site-specific DNA-methyltransferase (adenine-specific)